MKTLLIIAFIIAIVSFIPEQKRYFYIVYSAETSQQRSTGCYTVKDTKFPDLAALYDQAAKQSGLPKEHCIITNIIEFKSAEDFKNFNK